MTNHVSHPSVMTYQTHLDHVLLELAIYQQRFVEMYFVVLDLIQVLHHSH
jgi:hypothetical protein